MKNYHRIEKWFAKRTQLETKQAEARCQFESKVQQPHLGGREGQIYPYGEQRTTEAERGGEGPRGGNTWRKGNAAINAGPTRLIDRYAQRREIRSRRNSNTLLRQPNKIAHIIQPVARLNNHNTARPSFHNTWIKNADRNLPTNLRNSENFKFPHSA